MNKKKIFFIDPMSSSASLSQYDNSILKDISDCEIFFLGDYAFKYKDECRYNFVPVFKYVNKNKLLKPISYLLSLFKIFFKIIKYNPDVIHIQWLKLYSFEYLFYKLIKLLKKNIKVVFTAHNLLPHNSGKKHKKTFNKFYDLCDGIIVHTHSSRSKLISSFNVQEEKVHIIKHGVLKLKYDKSIVETYVKKFKEKYDLEGKIVFSALGSISYYKGTDLVLDAWSQSSELKNGAVKLLIAGRGSLHNPENLGLNNNCIIINRLLENEEFFALLQLSDVILLPYREISQSGVLLTAIGEEKPVIVSNVGGLTDPFSIGEIGWVLKENFNSNDLTNILESIVKDDSKLKSITSDHELWKEIIKAYDWENISKMTNQIYLNI